MRLLLLLIPLIFTGLNSYSQKLTGEGGELSMLGLNANANMWISKTTGFEVFGGVSSELGNFNPNDFEAGFKYLNTFLFNRTDRTYFGLMGKWKWMDLASETKVKVNLPVVGLLIGKEWLSQRKPRGGFAVELGYQYGSKNYEIMIDQVLVDKKSYDEFPLILNLQYTFYKRN